MRVSRQQYAADLLRPHTEEVSAGSGRWGRRRVHREASRIAEAQRGVADGADTGLLAGVAADRARDGAAEAAPALVLAEDRHAGTLGAWSHAAIRETPD